MFSESFKNILSKIQLILILFFLSLKVYAWDCTTNKTSFQLTFPGLTIQRDMDTIQPLTDWISSGLTNVYSCDSSASFGGPRFNIQEVSQGIATGQTYMENGTSYNILKTSVEGIGVILRAQNQSTGNISSYYQFPIGLWANPYFNAKFSANINIEARLIKIGRITSGTFQSIQIGLIRTVSSDYQGVYYYPVPIFLQGGNINVLSCTVINPVVNVSLGTFKKYKFSQVGYTTDSVDIPFAIDCLAGTKVNIMVSATVDSTLSDNGLVKLSETEGSASGVAVQILNKTNSGIMLNKVIPYSEIATQGPFDLGLRARYIQTLSKVTPGIANSTATITLTYR